MSGVKYMRDVTVIVGVLENQKEALKWLEGKVGRVRETRMWHDETELQRLSRGCPHKYMYLLGKQHLRLCTKVAIRLSMHSLRFWIVAGAILGGSPCDLRIALREWDVDDLSEGRDSRTGKFWKRSDQGEDLKDSILSFRHRYAAPTRLLQHMRVKFKDNVHLLVKELSSGVRMSSKFEALLPRSDIYFF